MARRRGSRPRPVAVAARLRDSGLRGRLAAEVAQAPDLVWVSDYPDVLVVDAAWWAEDGEAAPAAVVMVAAVDPAELTPAVRALLPPDANLLSIVAAVRLVAEGLLVLPDAAVDRLAIEDPGFDPEESGRYPVLTPREQEVLQLLAAGASNKIIARKLEVSVHTVKFHIASLLRKLGADGRLEAVGIGLRAGLLML